ncbi:MinD superfamily P-loop ATPase, contains an inserted ferredoxin domain [Caldanaerovirga acetigignens]|uniref:MinD superfamily P-loop ATPase, contains an inserted ferredoxin domain n=1 Tax=Caldanaerovirga acetigignens TaxID=447595 RepID=A0A1M7LMQ4_9FIRM|nr:ATP-binding protein [Caldanaerovirga acetigignens]SHM79410.1 MinD superfamily P-loop ATPase, contains an inserted ferredoxin domain [Caldanaerovirga acetigignens]
MKEIVVLSGKGGTGKTTLTASLAALAKNAVLADCDVDAPDLYLLLKPEIRETFEFWGSQKAKINKNKCKECGKCEEACRFGAIENFKVNAILCEGCRVCYNLCPQKAIDMEETLSGHWYISDTKYGPIVHARLGIAEENSGKLVSVVKKAAREIAERGRYEYIITDGPPGIGCPVISSLSGADMALIVTEPTAAGLHDLERVLKLAENFKVAIKVVINKFDLAQEKSKEIEQYCINEGIEVIGKIPFDEEIVRAVSKGVPPVEYSSGPAAEALKDVGEGIFT